LLLAVSYKLRESMSIAANKDTQILIQGGAAGLNAARRMAEFCYMIKRPLNVMPLSIRRMPGRPTRSHTGAAR